MGHIKAAWEALEERYSNRVGLAISFFVALVMLAGFIWGVCWSRAQDKKADERERVQDKKADERARVQDKKADERALTQKEQIKLLVSEQEKHINRLVSEQDQNIIQLEQSHKANTKKLTEEYAKIVSGEISDLKEEMKRFVERNGEMVLDETVRRIVASHENIERGRDDTYKKALYEGVEGIYISELNQEPNEVGSGVFVTDLSLRPGGGASNQDSPYLLTNEEIEKINDCIESYIEKNKTDIRKDEFVNKTTQEEIFWFLLRESDIGCITETLELEMTYRPLYEVKTEFLTPFAKLGIVIGHIGDKLNKYKLGF